MKYKKNRPSKYMSNFYYLETRHKILLTNDCKVAGHLFLNPVHAGPGHRSAGRSALPRLWGALSLISFSLVFRTFVWFSRLELSGVRDGIWASVILGRYFIGLNNNLGKKCRWSLMWKKKKKQQQVCYYNKTRDTGIVFGFLSGTRLWSKSPKRRRHLGTFFYLPGFSVKRIENIKHCQLPLNLNSLPLFVSSERPLNLLSALIKIVCQL